MPDNTQNYYYIEWQYGAWDDQKEIIAQVPFQMELNEQTRLSYAYTIAETIAKRMFMSQFVQKEYKGQLYPVYFADKLTGQTISVR